MKYMITEIEKQLFRYDLKTPPDEWNVHFLSDEYNTKEFGHKNKANLFFFTDSRDIANQLGRNALMKPEFNQSEYFITSTQSRLLKLIDFTNSNNIYQMLCVLKDLNIDVLINDMKTFEEENNFLFLKPIFENAELETNSQLRLEFIEQLKVHSNSNFEDISLFGQRLTDFNNGVIFKKIVQEIYPDVDGYIWREFNDKRGFSYCLFDSEKLLPKETETITI